MEHLRLGSQRLAWDQLELESLCQLAGLGLECISVELVLWLWWLSRRLWRSSWLAWLGTPSLLGDRHSALGQDV